MTTPPRPTTTPRLAEKDAPVDEPDVSSIRADRSDWLDPAKSRWAFHHVDRVLPTAPIATSVERDPLPAGPVAAFDDFALAGRGGAATTFDAWRASTATDGLAILVDGRVVHESYAHGNDASRPHIFMSATKSVVGLLVGVLVDRGEIDVARPVSDYVPEVAGSMVGGATLRELLDMQSGLVLDAATQAAYDAATGWRSAANGTVDADLHAFYRGLPPGRAVHGGPFRYVSANTDLLGWAIERATGASFADVLSTRLWRPMRAEADAYITVDDHGAARCTGGLCGTLRDLARVGQLVLDRGRRGDTEVVPAGWIDDLATGGDADAWRRGEWGQSFGALARSMRYRSGWYAIDDEPSLLFAMGIHGQNLFVDRTHRLVIAKLSSQALATDYAAIASTHRAVAEIRRCVVR